MSDAPPSTDPDPTDASATQRLAEARSEGLSEARFRLIADLVPDLLWQHDAQGLSYWCNRRWIEYTGQALTSAVGTGWMQAVHPEDRGVFHASFRQAGEAQNGEADQPRRREHRIRAADGTYRWFLVQASPLRDATGRVVSWFSSATDVDDQRHAIASLRETEERFRLVVEGARDYAIFMIDPDGCISTWNHGAERLLGWSEAEAIGQPADMIFTPEDCATNAPAREMASAVREGKAADLRWHLRKDGSRFWADGVMHGLRGDDGAVRGFVKVLRDETVRKQAADELHAAMEAAEAASTAKDEFLAILSHELRTPLAAILLWARMLRDRASTPTEIEEAVQAITSSAEAQRQLIDDLLDTSRITSGKLRIHMRDVDLLKCVREAIDGIKPTADAKGVTVHAQPWPRMDTVHADPDRLRQVIWNLLTNAVKFTPAGGRVEVAVEHTETAVEIRVSDSGEGIADEFLPYVFDSFRQADSSTTRRHGGLGLGLAIVKSLVEMHGGVVHATSAGPGRGATFVVRLPMVPSARRGKTSRRVPAASEAVRVPYEGVTLQGVSLLLVEDDEETRRALYTLLTRAGASVTACAAVPRALEQFAAARPDVIVSDIGLSQIDGNAFLREIRRREVEGGARPVPAVALTAFAGEEDRRRAIKAGFHTYLSKPVDAEQLLSALVELVERA